MRYKVKELEDMGFAQFRSTNAYFKEDAIASYGLIVAIKVNSTWVSADGLHNYSRTTSKQVTEITGVSTQERIANWRIVSIEAFNKELDMYLREEEI